MKEENDERRGGPGTRLPSPRPSVLLKYDAWNRLVEVKDGEDIAQQNECDGLREPIARADVAASPDVKYDYCYNDLWQLLEKRAG